MKSVAIVGGAEATAQFAPFGDPEWEIWGLAWHTTSLERIDLLFDIHDPDFKAHVPYACHYNSHLNEKYIAKVDASGLPIVCDPKSSFKNAIPYPLDEVRAALPKRDYLECTISYMVAYAIYKGATRIGLWGCHFTGKDEYQYQLPSLTWLLGYAEAKGIEIVIGPGGPLLASGCEAGRYGIDHNMRPRTAGPTDWFKVTMAIVVNNVPLRFCTPNDRAVFRVGTIETKEPKTVEWIRNLPPNSVLWDIGANIGIYSMYAAAYGHRAVAVEADEGHTRALARTVALSDLEDSVRIIHAALDDRMTIDLLVEKYGFEPPTCIKIDTDGSDLKVVRGAVKSLAGVHSVIVETDNDSPADKAEIHRILTDAGFKFTGRHITPGTNGVIGMDHWHKEP